MLSYSDETDEAQTLFATAKSLILGLIHTANASDRTERIAMALAEGLITEAEAADLRELYG